MEASKSLVLVVIPCHNKGQTIKRAIDSIKAQTLNNLICIVVDDSSFDNSKDIILAEIANDRRFRYEHVEFRNVALTRNYGISLTDAPYICTLDGDDWIELTFLEVCTKALIEDRSLGIAYTSLRTHNADGTSTISQWPGKFNPDAQLTYAKKQNQCPTCNVLEEMHGKEQAGINLDMHQIRPVARMPLSGRLSAPLATMPER